MTSAILETIMISTDQLHEMSYFYSQVLGVNMTPHEMGPEYGFQGSLGSFSLVLVPQYGQGGYGGNHSFRMSFIVPNLDHTLAVAQRAGARLLQRISQHGDERYCNITDPDGNRIELIETVAPYQYGNPWQH